MTKEIKQTKDIQTVIDELAIKGVEALNEMADFTQEQVDHIVHQAAIAALDKHMYLAKLAVDETGRGIYEDKAIKNMYASEYIWNSIKNDKTVGVIAEDKEQGLVSIAEPVGVICGVTPTTNPTSTTIFKALIALKTRNSIVLARSGRLAAHHGPVYGPGRFRQLLSGAGAQLAAVHRHRHMDQDVPAQHRKRRHLLR